MPNEQKTMHPIRYSYVVVTDTLQRGKTLRGKCKGAL
jgi:hypothetical protein